MKLIPKHCKYQTLATNREQPSSCDEELSYQMQRRTSIFFFKGKLHWYVGTLPLLNAQINCLCICEKMCPAFQWIGLSCNLPEKLPVHHLQKYSTRFYFFKKSLYAVQNLRVTALGKFMRVISLRFKYVRVKSLLSLS